MVFFAVCPRASIPVRRKALAIRVEVRDLPLALSQQGGAKLVAARPGSAGERGAAPTKPGRVSTARTRGSGERDDTAAGDTYAGGAGYRRLIRAGLAAHAQRLFLSEHTVHWHLASILRKLNLSPCRGRGLGVRTGLV